MAKLYLKSAYRMVPVHPEDSPLLGIQWKGETYFDQALPFGLRSAPIIFSAVADGLAWALFQSGVDYSLYYLDDFFFCSPCDSTSCQGALSVAIPLCHRLGIPVAPEKIKGPATSLTFLGINLDSEVMSISLPRERLASLRQRLSSWLNQRSDQSTSCRSYWPRESFLRAIIDAMKRPRRPHQVTRLDAQCRADIAWWAEWNGISVLPPPKPNITVLSDTSGSWGCGAFTVQAGEWLQLSWPQGWGHVNIAVKELLPVVLAAAVWERQWAGQHVLFISDNMAVVSTLSAQSTRKTMLSHLLRCLFFWEARFNFSHSAEHLAGKLNTAANALSRNNLSVFHSLTPQVKAAPSLGQGSSLLNSPSAAVITDRSRAFIGPPPSGKICSGIL